MQDYPFTPYGKVVYALRGLARLGNLGGDPEDSQQVVVQEGTPTGGPSAPPQVYSAPIYARRSIPGAPASAPAYHVPTYRAPVITVRSGVPQAEAVAARVSEAGAAAQREATFRQAEIDQLRQRLAEALGQARSGTEKQAAIQRFQEAQKRLESVSAIRRYRDFPDVYKLVRRGGEYTVEATTGRGVVTEHAKESLYEIQTRAEEDAIGTMMDLARLFNLGLQRPKRIEERLTPEQRGIIFGEGPYTIRSR